MANHLPPYSNIERSICWASTVTAIGLKTYNMAVMKGQEQVVKLHGPFWLLQLWLWAFERVKDISPPPHSKPSEVFPGPKEYLM